MCFLEEEGVMKQTGQKSLSKGLFFSRKLCYSIRETYRSFSEEDTRP